MKNYLIVIEKAANNSSTHIAIGDVAQNDDG